MPYQKEIKGIKLLQDKATETENLHQSMFTDLADIKGLLAQHVSAEEDVTEKEIEEEEGISGIHAKIKVQYIAEMSVEKPLKVHNIANIYTEAEQRYSQPVSLSDILTAKDFEESRAKYNLHIQDFNKRYALDAWDYAIASSCGLFAAMLDIFFLSAPPKPTTSYTQKVDGIFNQWVQNAFNTVIPPDLSEALSNSCTIGAPDASTITQLIDAPDKALNPMNHRLRSLSHDPILGLIFGVWDMMHGTCTIVNEGKIISVAGKAGSTDGNIFQLIGRMFGHLLSDVNAPSAKGNRGMGLPAPFMGILRMFEGIPIGDSNFGKQIEWMYVNGYDFRQFVVTSIPMTIMEILLRVFYTIKQMSVYGAEFGVTILDTMPLHMNPRFRMMLAMAYGTSSAVNAGKVYITQNLLNANYASWMGFAWNGFHALKWALLDKHLKFWDGVTAKEIAEIENIITKLDELEKRASALPS